MTVSLDVAHERSTPLGAPELLRAGDELFEAQVLAQRVEVGIDFEPAGREIGGVLQQPLELIESLLRLADERLSA
jgi:hypothetical protein